MGYPASEKLPARPAYYEGHGADHESNVGLKLLALFLGLAVGVMIPVGLVLAHSAQNARNDARAAAAKAAAAPAATAMPGMAHRGTASASEGTYATPSFAGIAPADADAIAMKHQAAPAALPAAPAGPVALVNLGINHRTLTIAPGIRYQAWTFGKTAPGPAIHVRQGQLVKVRLTNTSPMPHSVDFHAAQIAPNVAFTDIQPGQSKTFSFVASTPGVFMYHCGTSPAFMHIANGMYGAIVVEPKNMPPAQKQYVLVASEWYLNAPGNKAPAALDLTKANNMTPDWVTWNGYAHQYKEHPLTAMPGDTVRFWVVGAGPSLNTEFHVVGTVFSRAWIDAAMSDTPEHGVQTAIVPAGGGGVFDVKVTRPGIYPFVSHSFASVNLGEVGLLKVGHVAGTMGH